MPCMIFDCKETNVHGNYCSFHNYEFITKKCKACLHLTLMKRYSLYCEECMFSAQKRKPIMVPTYTFVPKK